MTHRVSVAKVGSWIASVVWPRCPPTPLQDTAEAVEIGVKVFKGMRELGVNGFGRESATIASVRSTIFGSGNAPVRHTRARPSLPATILRIGPSARALAFYEAARQDGVGCGRSRLGTIFESNFPEQRLGPGSRYSWREGPVLAIPGRVAFTASLQSAKKPEQKWFTKPECSASTGNVSVGFRSGKITVPIQHTPRFAFRRQLL